MKAHRIQSYNSILPLLSAAGCPFCRFLKNYQSSLLQERDSKEVRHLCNFHAWGFAAIQEAESAADIFLQLLTKATDAVPPSGCDICLLLHLEEDSRIREFLAYASDHSAVEWIRSQQSSLCIPHGMKLKHAAPPTLAASIGTILTRYRESLIADLTSMLGSAKSDTTHWGVLGHAAEFLVAQRGLYP